MFPADAPLADVVFQRTYARKKADGNMEQWNETVERCVDGNLALVDPQFIEPGERERLIRLIGRTAMLPAGRHLWVSGVPGKQYVSNCFVAGWDSLADHLCFTFESLMVGGGVGANYSAYNTRKVAPLLHRVALRFVCDPTERIESCTRWGVEDDMPQFGHLLQGEQMDDPPLTYFHTIADSREGWVEALRLLVLWAQQSSVTLVFDVSRIRPAGSPIRGFGGTAAGPICLMNMLLDMNRIFRRTEGHQPTPLDLMEMDHAIASCVVAGNVRRSARMAILHWADPHIFDFLECKIDPSKHWSTNISVEIDDSFFAALGNGDSAAQQVFDEVVDGMLLNGEPGFFNSSLASVGERSHVAATNPCGEIPLEPYESCLLGHVNLGSGDPAEIRESFRLMTRFLVRATFATKHNHKQRDIVAKNRRIGVGFLGLQEWLARKGIKMSHASESGLFRTYLGEWKLIVQHTARIYSLELGIPTPIKTTTVAPTGSIAHLAGTSAGMEAIKAKYFVRRVRYAASDSEVQRLSEQGIVFETDLYTEGTVVACFPCKDPLLDRVDPALVEEAGAISPSVLMDLQSVIQRYYADNAISHTITVAPGQYTTKELGSMLRYRLPHLKGLTIFPSGTRPQQPITAVTQEEYEALVKGDSIDMDDAELACSTGGCPIR